MATHYGGIEARGAGSEPWIWEVSAGQLHVVLLSLLAGSTVRRAAFWVDDGRPWREAPTDPSGSHPLLLPLAPPADAASAGALDAASAAPAPVVRGRVADLGFDVRGLKPPQARRDNTIGIVFAFFVFFRIWSHSSMVRSLGCFWLIFAALLG